VVKNVDNPYVNKRPRESSKKKKTGEKGKIVPRKKTQVKGEKKKGKNPRDRVGTSEERKHRRET